MGLVGQSAQADGQIARLLARVSLEQAIAQVHPALPAHLARIEIMLLLTNQGWPDYKITDSEFLVSHKPPGSYRPFPVAVSIREVALMKMRQRLLDTVADFLLHRPRGNMLGLAE